MLLLVIPQPCFLVSPADISSQSWTLGESLHWSAIVAFIWNKKFFVVLVFFKQIKMKGVGERTRVIKGDFLVVLSFSPPMKSSSVLSLTSQELAAFSQSHSCYSLLKPLPRAPHMSVTSRDPRAFAWSWHEDSLVTDAWHSKYLYERFQSQSSVPWTLAPDPLFLVHRLKVWWKIFPKKHLGCPSTCFLTLLWACFLPTLLSFLLKLLFLFYFL